MRPFVKVPLVYGLVAALLATILSIVLYYLDVHPMLIPFYLDARILLFMIFIFFSLKELRDNYRGGVLYFGEGLICCFLFVCFFAVTSSLLLGIFAWAEGQFVSSFVTLFREQMREQLQMMSEEELKRFGKENIERNLEQLSSTNSFWIAWNYFTQSYLLGAPISIIFSVILRRQPKTP